MDLEITCVFFLGGERMRNQPSKALLGGKEREGIKEPCMDGGVSEGVCCMSLRTGGCQDFCIMPRFSRIMFDLSRRLPQTLDVPLIIYG